MKQKCLSICLDVDQNGVYSGKDYNYIVEFDPIQCFNDRKQFTLDDEPDSIKISKFKNAGYIYYGASKL